MKPQCSLCDEISLHNGLCSSHYWKKYHSEHKSRRVEQSKQWRSRNPEYWRNKDQDKDRDAKRRYENSHRSERNSAEALRRIDKAEEIRAERRSPRGRERSKIHSHNRRARLRGVPTEQFTDAQLIARWGLDCYLCGKPIDMSAPRHASRGIGWELGLQREHVMPIAKSGANTLENVRPAHGICNLRKSDKLLDMSETE